MIDMSGHDLVSPPYNHRNAPANGMLYSPSRLDTVSSLRALGSALALTHRDQADFQSLPLDDKRRLLIQGKADWSEPAARHLAHPPGQLRAHRLALRPRTRPDRTRLGATPRKQRG